MELSIHERARRALMSGLQKLQPHLSVDAYGRTPSLVDNLEPGISRAWFEADFLESTGPDFEDEMREPAASSALAVNLFAPWRTAPSSLSLAGRTGFHEIQFDRICQTPLSGPPAYLDFFAQGEIVVGVEIKCLEYLQPPSSKYEQLYREAYQEASQKITDDRSRSGWFGQIRLLQENPQTFKHLFAAQLIKQFIAITHIEPRRESTLLYLYWEPTNWRNFNIFNDHRSDLQRFANGVNAKSASVTFMYQSLSDLWTEWKSRSGPNWLRNHLQYLQARFDVEI